MKNFRSSISKWLLLVASMTLAGVVGAARPPDAGGGNGNKPPGGETATNNLSYPAKFFGVPSQTGVIGSYTFGASFPNGMSFGCLKPETIGTTTFPNTSCVNQEASVVTPISTEACVAPGGPCEGFALENIFWQKNALNKWQAGYLGSSVPLTVSHVDWGDNLEGRTWPVQVLRVETNTFGTLLGGEELMRFDMWHVFGAGTNELWGAHATTGNVPYIYAAWPYVVNVSSTARLNIAKLANGSSTCPVTATGVSQSPFSPVWNSTDHVWTGTWLLRDITYGPELNIKGSYVYGFNWNLRSDAVPVDVNKAGWWRLTFYTPDNSVDFSTWQYPDPMTIDTLAPPTAALTPSPMAAVVPEAEEGETGLRLYVPQVDQIDNLTYLDICISPTKGGGGKRK